jgi:hypothetical protein
VFIVPQPDFLMGNVARFDDTCEDLQLGYFTSHHAGTDYALLARFTVGSDQCDNFEQSKQGKINAEMASRAASEFI